MIKLENLSFSYPSGKGIKDINFNISNGETVAYLGPNGAGKSTTMRILMGFTKSMNGTARIDNKDCFKQSADIHKFVGYLPGETAFPENFTGKEFLDYISGLRGMKNFSKQKNLLEMFELNPVGSIKKYSKGMKQKLGIVSAFMHDPSVIILDEPTSGLDPLMQKNFIELVKAEQKQGKTILLSSHNFDETEKLAERFLIIKNGQIIKDMKQEELQNLNKSTFVISSTDAKNVQQALLNHDIKCSLDSDNSIKVIVSEPKTDAFIKTISQFKINTLSQKKSELEDLFIHFYEN